jgi:transposase
MPSIVAKTVRGRKYWQIVESRRVNGQPRSFVVAHLGRPETLLARLQAGPGALRVRSRAHGAVAAVWAEATRLDVAALIDAQVPRDRRGRLPRRDGLTPGQSLVLAMLARACRPVSKRAFAAWAATTSLGEVAGVAVRRLTSQHFWDQMAAVPRAALPGIEEQLVRRVVDQEQIAPDTLFYDTTNFFTFIASTNSRPHLPQRGHNKQKRHDLRQLGLALVVSRDGQLPLFHLLYEGARPDVRTFPEVLTSVRTRVERLWGAAPPPLTLVYDKGNVSRATQAQVGGTPLHYVTSLVPSQHPALLAEAVTRLAPVALPSGEVVAAYRTRRVVWGQERTLVVLRSERLRAGQVRGLHQHLATRLRALGALTARLEAPRGGRGTRAGLERAVAELLRGQHLRRLLRVEILEEQGRWRLAASVDAAEYQRLTETHFGLRIVMTDRDDLTTAEILAAYRGQARAERAFRDMKDPEGCALRPQYHWTDQKLEVHAFCCVMAFLLLKLLDRRARRAGLAMRSPRGLLRALGEIRQVTVLEPGPRGRPRARQQLEDLDAALEPLAACFGLGPPPST